MEEVLIFKKNFILASVRMSGGHFCNAEAPIKTTVETQKTTGILTYFKAFKAASIKFYRKTCNLSYEHMFLHLKDKSIRNIAKIY